MRRLRKKFRKKRRLASLVNSKRRLRLGKRRRWCAKLKNKGMHERPHKVESY